MKEKIAAVAIASALVALVVGVLVANSKKHEKKSDCQKACDVIVSNVMEEECYCKTETGWVRK